MGQKLSWLHCTGPYNKVVLFTMSMWYVLCCQLIFWVTVLELRLLNDFHIPT